MTQPSLNEKRASIRGPWKVPKQSGFGLLHIVCGLLLGFVAGCGGISTRLKLPDGCTQTFRLRRARPGGGSAQHLRFQVSKWDPQVVAHVDSGHTLTQVLEAGAGLLGGNLR